DKLVTGVQTCALPIYFLSLLANLCRGETEQTDRGILHHLRFGINGDGEDARHIDADVLGRQRASQRHLNLDRLETEIGVILNERSEERRVGKEVKLGR